MGYYSPLSALDAFFAVVRARAERDPEFAAELAKACNFPIEVRVDTPTDMKAALPFLDPIALAGRGAETFRAVFGVLKDADKRRVIKHYDLASAETLKGPPAPKGEALYDLLWDGATARRRRIGLS